MRIVTICVCYNEERMLPFFLDYYTGICDEIVFFDGNSTDKSVDIIRSYMGKTKCNIELRINQSIGTIDYFDYGHLTDYWHGNWNNSLYYIRNYGWQTLFSKQDNNWVMIVDVDEFLYHPQGLRNRLQILHGKNITLPCLQGFDMVSDSFPTLNPGEFLWDHIRSGFWSQEQTKQLIFDGQYITDMKYSPGCHYHDAQGFLSRDIDTPFIDQIKKLHYRYLGYEYLIERETRKYHNVSRYNVERGMSCQYKQHIEFTLNDFNKLKHCDTYYDDVFSVISLKKPKS